MLGDGLRRRAACEGMVIRDKIERLMLSLQLQVLAHGPEIIANVQSA